MKFNPLPRFFRPRPHKTLSIVAVLVALVTLVGCAGTKSSDPRILIQPSLRVEALAPRLNFGDDNILRLTVPLQSRSSEAHKIFITVEWLDGLGQKVDTIVGSRQPFAVPAFGSNDFTINAPRPDIVTFRIRIEKRE
ncbi:MAG: hypothetical protein ORO03_07580 [Alphaproteobacteria bacterium]|nr:hypothetical protein [Alphaproteobacteria bacterium]